MYSRMRGGLRGSVGVSAPYDRVAGLVGRSSAITEWLCWGKRTCTVSKARSHSPCEALRKQQLCRKKKVSPPSCICQRRGLQLQDSGIELVDLDLSNYPIMPRCMLFKMLDEIEFHEYWNSAVVLIRESDVSSHAIKMNFHEILLSCPNWRSCLQFVSAFQEVLKWNEHVLSVGTFQTTQKWRSWI